MTDIPGTGKFITKEEIKTVSAQVENISVVNVHELKKGKQEITEESTVWYYRLNYWILFGFGVSLIFALLALVNWRFLLITPVGPLIGIASWHVKNYVEKIEKKHNLIK